MVSCRHDTLPLETICYFIMNVHFTNYVILSSESVPPLRFHVCEARCFPITPRRVVAYVRWSWTRINTLTSNWRRVGSRLSVQIAFSPGRRLRVCGTLCFPISTSRDRVILARRFDSTPFSMIIPPRDSKPLKPTTQSSKCYRTGRLLGLACTREKYTTESRICPMPKWDSSTTTKARLERTYHQRRRSPKFYVNDFSVYPNIPRCVVCLRELLTSLNMRWA